nr:Uncharacterised protein [Raoultella sp. NCTC 9187]
MTDAQSLSCHTFFINVMNIIVLFNLVFRITSMEVIGPIQVKIENERPIALFMQVFS